VIYFTNLFRYILPAVSVATNLSIPFDLFENGLSDGIILTDFSYHLVTLGYYLS
jgi:hypothetical protein